MTNKIMLGTGKVYTKKEYYSLGIIIIIMPGTHSMYILPII